MPVPVADWVEEFVAVPAGSQRAGFGLAVADHNQSDEVRIVENGPVGMRDAVAKLAAFVNAAGRFGCGVAADAAGKGKLLKEVLQPRDVFALFRIDFGVCSFEICLRQYGRRSVAGATDEDRIQVVLLDQAVEVDVGEGLTGV